MPFTDKDRHLTKAFQREKHDTVSQLLKEYERPGARRLPEQDDRPIFLKICRKFWAMFVRQSADSLPMIGRCSVGVPEGVA